MHHHNVRGATAPCLLQIPRSQPDTARSTDGGSRRCEWARGPVVDSDPRLCETPNIRLDDSIRQARGATVEPKITNGEMRIGPIRESSDSQAGDAGGCLRCLISRVSSCPLPHLLPSSSIKVLASFSGPHTSMRSDCLWGSAGKDACVQ